MRWLAGLMLAGALVASAQELEYGNGLDVPYVPTPPEVVTGMLKLAGVKKTDFVIDLGCGDGRIVVAAAKEFGAKAMGYDLDPQRIKEANENAKSAGVTERVKFVEMDIFKAEIKDASVVTMYLLPSVNEKLKPRLLAELKPGTRVVSHSFNMPDWKPEQEIQVNGRTLYLWKIPAK
ncbi:MAG: class I SAM-dependent methyltransferase [Bryobacter sp.]|nr:class I SAM-dependent methyltransferase [Bryobacter sp.]